MFNRDLENEEQENWSFPTNFNKYSGAKPKSRLGHRRKTQSEAATHPITPARNSSLEVKQGEALRDIANILQEPNPILNDSLLISDSSTTETTDSRSGPLSESFKTPGRSFYLPCVEDSPLDPLQGILNFPSTVSSNTLYFSPTVTLKCKDNKKNNVFKTLFGKTQDTDRSFGISRLDEKRSYRESSLELTCDPERPGQCDAVRNTAVCDSKPIIFEVAEESNSANVIRGSSYANSDRDTGTHFQVMSNSRDVISYPSDRDTGTHFQVMSNSRDAHTEGSDVLKFSSSHSTRPCRTQDSLQCSQSNNNSVPHTLKPIPGIDKITQNICSHFAKSASISSSPDEKHRPSLLTSLSSNHLPSNSDIKSSHSASAKGREPVKSTDLFNLVGSTIRHNGKTTGLFHPLDNNRKCSNDLNDDLEVARRSKEVKVKSDCVQSRLLTEHPLLGWFKRDEVISEKPLIRRATNDYQVLADATPGAAGRQNPVGYGSRSYEAQGSRAFSDEVGGSLLGEGVKMSHLSSHSEASNPPPASRTPVIVSALRNGSKVEASKLSTINLWEKEPYKNGTESISILPVSTRTEPSVPSDCFQRASNTLASGTNSCSPSVPANSCLAAPVAVPIDEIDGKCIQSAPAKLPVNSIFQASLIKNESSMMEGTEVPPVRSNIFQSSIIKHRSDDDRHPPLPFNNSDNLFKRPTLPSNHAAKTSADSLWKNNLIGRVSEKPPSVMGSVDRQQDDVPLLFRPAQKEEALVKKPQEQGNMFRKPEPVVQQRLVRQNPNLPDKVYVKGTAYPVLSLLGKGGSSKVYQALGENSKVVAIKCVDLSSVDQTIANGYLNEINLLAALQSCSSVIKMHSHEYVEECKKLFVVMEKGDTDFADLIKSISKTKKISMPMIIYYWTEMLTCVNDIHEKGVIHSDLKPANFLLVGGRLKLIDFGIASSLQEDMTSIVKDVTTGTFNYMSPEAIINHSNTQRGHKISYKSDVWSLGCILYQLLYGRTPYSHITQMWAKMQAIGDPKCLPPYPSSVEVPTGLHIALRWCLNKDAKRRPTTKQLLDLPYYPPSLVTVRGAHIRSQLYAHIMEMFPDCPVTME